MPDFRMLAIQCEEAHEHSTQKLNITHILDQICFGTILLSSVKIKLKETKQHWLKCNTDIKPQDYVQNLWNVLKEIKKCLCV